MSGNSLIGYGYEEYVIEYLRIAKQPTHIYSNCCFAKTNIRICRVFRQLGANCCGIKKGFYGFVNENS